MKFIFPNNYNFKSKFLGIIDYSSIFLNLFWNFFVFILINFFNNLNIKIFLFFLLSFPIFLFTISGFNGEKITYVFKYILMFLFKKKILFFS